MIKTGKQQHEIFGIHYAYCGIGNYEKLVWIELFL